MYAYAERVPDSLGVGLTARAASFHVDTGEEWVADVDALPVGAVWISAQEYRDRLAAIEAHNAAIPEPEAP